MHSRAAFFPTTSLLAQAIRRQRLALGALALSALPMAPVMAADAAPAAQSDSPTLKAVTVTATRREASLQQVPVAVSVVDGEQLERENRNSVASIVQQVPSLNFRTGDARLVDTLGDNARELARIAALMERIVTQREFHVDSIVLTASASPEGRRGLNERLSRARAEALRSYLAGCFGRRADRLLTIRSAGELWPELTARIARDDRLAHRDEILGIIRRIGDPDRREEEIRRRYPAEYACIRAEHYPALRAVKLRCHLRRVGMVKDTIHTTELDTAYLRGRQLLEKRKYAQALYVLHDYRDRNTAIALLSLGQDREALRILEALPATAISEYLRAIACSRLGRKAEGRRHFLEACRRDERMEYRAALDPEIDELLKD